jgi:CheY-like chemotaxis protein
MRRSVYIIDDSADYRLLLTYFFGRFMKDYPIEFFDGGRSFLTRKSQIDQLNTPDALPSVIVLDLHMPDIDGYEVLKALRHSNGSPATKWKNIPVVINSSDSSESTKQYCYELGAGTCLRKSAELVDLHNLKDYLLQSIGKD